MRYIKNYLRKLVFIYRLSSKSGYLYKTGWIKSVQKRMPVAENGNPVPWFTICFNYFLEDRLNKNMLVFEYGSGNSTLYFASRVASLTSIEHDYNWYCRMKDLFPDNVKYHFQDLNQDYSSCINKLGGFYDIIIIDGRNRVECAQNSINHLKENGIIIWDNSLREKYRTGLEFLAEKGFKRIDFKGLNPGGTVVTVTSVFYKNNNCLNI